jgi:hypothetical protein
MGIDLSMHGLWHHSQYYGFLRCMGCIVQLLHVRVLVYDIELYIMYLILCVCIYIYICIIMCIYTVYLLKIRHGNINTA